MRNLKIDACGDSSLVPTPINLANLLALNSACDLRLLIDMGRSKVARTARVGFNDAKGLIRHETSTTV